MTRMQDRTRNALLDQAKEKASEALDFARRGMPASAAHASAEAIGLLNRAGVNVEQWAAQDRAKQLGRASGPAFPAGIDFGSVLQ